MCDEWSEVGKDFAGRENPLTFKSARRFTVFAVTITHQPPVYPIGEISARSGFSAATLRYYEQIGILHPTTRTAAGYRLYDDHALDRLAFIARAKQLGCSLEEISDLNAAWDGGECGPVQDRLQSLVDRKLAAARQRIVELVTLTAELEQTRVALERHRPEGPCDDRCGCVSDPEIPAAQPVTLSTKFVTPRTDGPPVTCALGAAEIPERMEAWRSALTHAVTRVAVDGGLRVTFDHRMPLTDLAELVAAEQRCCSFFDFSITIDRRGVALEARAPADALPIVLTLLGAPK